MLGKQASTIEKYKNGSKGLMKPKKYSYRFRLTSAELKDFQGNGVYHINIKTDNPDKQAVIKKYRDRQKAINDKYKAEINGELVPDEVPKKNKKYKEDHKPLKAPDITTLTKVMPGGIVRTDFKLILNKGTNTTTSALIGSSFAAGKSTIMMNAILPYFYGAKRKFNKVKDTFDDVKSKKVMIDGEKVDYINMLFCANPQIKAYQGLPSLVKVNGFSTIQQELIEEAASIQKSSDNKYRFGVFIDDIIDIRHSKMISRLYMTLRNCEISSTVCVQYLKLISKECRNNIQNLIFCKLMSDEAILDVINVYLKSYFVKMGCPKEDYVNLYRQLTEDFNFIHLHQGTAQLFFCKKVKSYV